MTEKDEFSLQDFLPFLLNRAAEESSLAFQTHYKNRMVCCAMSGGCCFIWGFLAR